MFKKLNSRIGLTFLIILALLIVGVAYILYTSDDDEVKSARQSSEGRLVESDDVVVERAGNWSAQEAKSASSGSYLYSSGSPDDVLTLTFVGSRVEVIYSTGTNLGTLAVDVDHTVLRTVITADETTKYQERTVVDYLEDGLHTLRVYAQEGGVIGIDAFRVSRGEGEILTIDRDKLPDEVIETAQTEGNVCVEVALQDPEPASSRPAGQLRNPELIEQLQDAVLAGIKEGSFDVRIKFTVIPGFGGYADLTALVELQSMPNVISIDKCLQGYESLDSSVPRIRADQVRNHYNITGRGMVIAVIDSGIDYDHPDLSDSIIEQYCAHVSTSNGCPAASNPAADSTGHGTLVAGVLTANGVSRNNNNPLLGVAPNSKIVAIRVENNLGGFNSLDIQAALQFIITNQNNLSVDAINISLGLGNGSNPDHFGTDCNNDNVLPNLYSFITEAHNLGIKIFAASGNSNNLTGISIPSCYDRVISVGATNDNDQIWVAAPLGTDRAANLDFMAPGDNITTTWYTGNTLTVSGTSVAAPHATATGILIEQANPPHLGILSDNPPNSASQFRTTLRLGSAIITDAPPPNGTGLQFHRIDALSSVVSVLPDTVAGAPANDFANNAQLLPSLGTLSEDYEYIQDPLGAGTIPDDDIPLPSACGGSNYSNTVWYSYSDTSSYNLSLSTLYTTYDTILAVYENSIANNTLVICNDDISILNFQSAVNFQVNSNSDYYIMLAQKGSAPFPGLEGLHLWVSRADAGDTLVTFDVTHSRVRILSSLRFNTKPIDVSSYPTGNPVGIIGTNRRWVMGDWNGDGQKTPGFYIYNGSASSPPYGTFFYTNMIGTATDNALYPLTRWTGIRFNNLPLDPLRGFPVAGRFDPTVNHDCVGIIDSGNYPPYGLAFAMHFTCDLTTLTPPTSYQWLSVLLPDSQGFTGEFQFTAGDFGTDGDIQPNFVPDGIDTIAVRRGQYIAFSNTPPTTLSAAFPYAQYLNYANSNSGPTYGSFVAGDWETNWLDSFGVYFNFPGTFWRRNNLEWNNPINITQGIGTMGLDVTYSAASWRETTPVWPTP